MYVGDNVSVTAIATAGEHVALSSDSFWQVPARWEGLSLYSGPADGQGAKVLAPGLVRFYINNEVAAATGTSAMTYMVRLHVGGCMGLASWEGETVNGRETVAGRGKMASRSGMRERVREGI
eukprot:1400148-Pleurochrysis_carterae.AAC.1